MPLNTFLEEFGLDRDLIARDRDMCGGFARAHARNASISENENERFLNGMAAATENRRAGAHSILLSDRRKAIEHFVEAGLSYCRVRNPYGLLMFALADNSPGDLRGLAREFGFIEGEVSERLQLCYLAVAMAAGGGETSLADQIGGSLATPLGILGLPAGNYMELAYALTRREREPLARAIAPFLFAYNNAMARAAENEHHWRLLAMPFHPAEPDVLSVVFLAEAVMRQDGERFIAGLLERMPLHQNSANLLFNAVLERFDDDQDKARR